MSKGVLAVVSGFSGAGKGTVMKRLMEKYHNYAFSVSVYLLFSPDLTGYVPHYFSS